MPHQGRNTHEVPYLLRLVATTSCPVSELIIWPRIVALYHFSMLCCCYLRPTTISMEDLHCAAAAIRSDKATCHFYFLRPFCSRQASSVSRHKFLLWVPLRFCVFLPQKPPNKRSLMRGPRADPKPWYSLQEHASDPIRLATGCPHIFASARFEN